MCLLGATTEDLADFFGVSSSTVSLWITRHADFSGALKAGKSLADAGVADRLYQRARGYTHKAVKMFFDSKTCRVIQAQYIEHYAPDTAAAIFWLKNRQSRYWRNDPRPPVEDDPFLDPNPDV